MGLYRGNCPECNSGQTVKEKMSGQETGDLICLGCKFTGPARDFKKIDEPDKEITKEK